VALYLQIIHDIRIWQENIKNGKLNPKYLNLKDKKCFQQPLQRSLSSLVFRYVRSEQRNLHWSPCRLRSSLQKEVLNQRISLRQRRVHRKHKILPKQNRKIDKIWKLWVERWISKDDLLQNYDKSFQFDIKKFETFG